MPCRAHAGQDDAIRTFKFLGIGRDNATRGNGVVIGNPHFPWAGNERFWEFQLQVKGDLEGWVDRKYLSGE